MIFIQYSKEWDFVSFHDNSDILLLRYLKYSSMYAKALGSNERKDWHTDTILSKP